MGRLTHARSNGIKEGYWKRHLGKQVEIVKSNYKNIQNVIRQFHYINGTHGAKCTQVLKQRVRKEWESAHKEYDITYVWGMDLDEKNRAERIIESMPEFSHEFPLIDRRLKKQDAHAILNKLGIRRPVMYDLGYSNNNCIGCVKGGMGYWNKIRVDFPEVFERMEKLEREVGHSCINGVFLDELDPKRGKMSEEIMQECGIMCYLTEME